MGLFDNMKQAMDAAKDGFAQAKDQLDTAKAGFQDYAEQARLAQDELQRNAPIINPTDQADVDRINAGTGAGIGVVSGNRNNLESGENVFRTNAQISVRMRLTGGGLGEASWHKIWTSSGVIRALVPGTEIPVEIDRAALTVTSVDAKLIGEALKERKKGGGR